MNRRRAVRALLAPAASLALAALWPQRVLPQTRQKVYRIGFLGSASPTPEIERAMKQKVPVLHWQPYTAEQGALLVQGIDIAKQHKRAASYVERILKGARAGDLPIEQVTTDELIVNLRTAKALGLKVSQSVLLRADKVIQ